MSEEEHRKRAKSDHYPILGMGNPLLDISAAVPMETLDKFELKLNNCVLATEKEMPVYKHLQENFKVEYTAGGATQNSIRLAQWMLQEPGLTAYIGAVGDDDFGEQLSKSAQADGVHTEYYTSKLPTGKCAVLVHDNERSLVPHLAAAEDFDPAHLDKESTKRIWESAKIVYSAGFFISHDGGFSAISRVAQFCEDTGRTYALNLAAGFVVTVFAERLLKLIALADFVFGNESEAQEFGKHQKWEDCSPAAVALKITQLPKKKDSKPRICVITQGPDPTLLAVDGKVMEFKPLFLDKSKIVDTNGAGDAFVGGFLAALYREKDLETCVRAGQYASSVILQESGVSIPPMKPTFEL